MLTPACASESRRKLDGCSFSGWSSSGARTIKLTVFKILNSYFCFLAVIVSPGPALSHRILMCFVSHWTEADALQGTFTLLQNRICNPWSSRSPYCARVEIPHFLQNQSQAQEYRNNRLNVNFKMENLTWLYNSKVLNETGRIIKKKRVTKITFYKSFLWYLFWKGLLYTFPLHPQGLGWMANVVSWFASHQCLCSFSPCSHWSVIRWARVAQTGLQMLQRNLILSVCVG